MKKKEEKKSYMVLRFMSSERKDFNMCVGL